MPWLHSVSGANMYRTDAIGVEALVLDNAADDIERLLEENKKLRETVKYYAIESNWEYWLKNQSIASIRAWQTLEELK